MNVVVAGGTGFIGTHLCPELARRGHEVTALARHPDGTDFGDADVQTAAADVTDYDTLVGPVEGSDVVVNLVALSPLFEPKGGNQRHFEVHLGGTENVVRAAEGTDIEKVVQMSALGADPDGPTAYIRAKGEAEQVVRDSDISWTIFRPSVIFGEGGEFLQFTKKLAPPYVTPLPGGGRTRFQPIWIGDFVPMVADAIEGSEARRGRGEGGASDAASESDSEEEESTDPHVGRTYELCGPEKLTLAQVARLVHAAEGRPVNVVPVPMGLAGVGLKTLGSIPGFPMSGDQYRSLRFDNTTEDNDISSFGVNPEDLTTLASYLGVDSASREEG